MAASGARAGADAAEIKTAEAVQRCSHTGNAVRGLQVLRPLRFFVSASQLL